MIIIMKVLSFLICAVMVVVSVFNFAVATPWSASHVNYSGAPSSNSKIDHVKVMQKKRPEQRVILSLILILPHTRGIRE